MTLIVHHLENSRSQRVLWLLEELGVDYEIKRYNRNPETNLAPDELRKVHPLGKSPLIEDGGRIYAETGNIIEHLVENHGGGMLRPEVSSEAFQRYRFWMHYAEGSIMPLLVMRLIFNRVRESPAPFFIKPIVKGVADKVDAAFLNPQTKLHFDYVEAELGKTTWLCGDDLSAADVMMSFPLEAAGSRMSMGAYGKIKAFVDRVHARPAYQRALEKGGPYAYGPKT